MTYDVDDKVALIGLAGTFPGAADIARLWRNLATGHEAIRFPSREESLAAGVPPRLLADPEFIRAVAEPPGVRNFDAEFFGFTPRDAALLDPQIRMFLEVGHAAIENAGYDPERVGTGTGVFGAVGFNAHRELHILPSVANRSTPATGMALSSLTNADFPATHLAYRFGFTGPAMTVLSACSSAALAVHLACQSLRTGECDLALAGGAAAVLPLNHGYRWDEGGPLSPDGHCRPFDARAAGTVFGTGAGAVLLKRFEDAVADGDHVWAVIRASAVNNDGSARAGFATPGLAGQAAMVAEAMRMADVRATDISYLEAHATGTPLGDPIELAALAQAYQALGAAELTEPIPLSSVKGGLGHLGHASGIASLIKLALSLAHSGRPATVNFTEANPRLRLEQTPFAINDKLLPWERAANRPRIAGMSSLGVGGTNVHLIVQEGPEPVRTAPGDRPQVVVWSAASEAAVRDYEGSLADHLLALGDDAFVDTAGTLQDGRTAHPVRAAAVATDTAELIGALERDHIVRGAPSDYTRPVAFLFPGQAAQRPRMAAGLYGVDGAFTDTMDRCLTLFAGHGVSVRQAWLGGAELTDTALAQPLLFAVEYALAAMWRSWGIEPAAVLGHSVGELTAGTVAGVFSLEDAVGLVAARATATASAPRGAMLAVAAGPNQLTLPDGVTVAVVNEPRQTVLSGPTELIEQIAATLRAERIGCRPLTASHAFHSPMMAPAVAAFTAAFANVRISAPAIPLISAATGATVTATSPEFWAGQLVAPVRFDRALDELLTEQRLLLEVGPGQTLSALAGKHIAVRDGASLVVPTMPRDGGDEHCGALAAAATVWTEGHRVDWAAVRQGEPVRRLPIPGYPYQKARHWLGLPRPAELETPVPQADPFSALSWVERHRGPGAAAAGGVALALLPDDVESALPAVLAVQQAGYRLVVARPGHEYAETAGEFRVRLDRPADLDRVVDALPEVPTLLVHGLALPAWEPPIQSTVDEMLDASFHSFAALAKCGARHGVTGLVVLATRSVDLTGIEPVDPAKATLHGAVRSLAQEAPELHCRLIDLVQPAEDDLAAELVHEVADPVVALRGPARWVRTERPYRPAPAATPALRRDGVYVLTGGLGGLGLAVARAMAGSGLRPRLVLVGRRGVTDQAQRAEIAALEGLGARIQVERCDIADRRSVSRLFDTVRAHHGAIHGVVHLAGVPGNGMLVLRERTDADAVLRPKVAGTLILAEVTSGQAPLDFFVTFSSRAGIDGLVGGADYAAANAFLDAQVRLLARSGVAAFSVNWPSWHTVGMAAVEPAPPADHHWRTVLDAAQQPILDEHRLDGIPVLPGTGHLDLVVRALREAIGPDDALPRFDDVVFQRVLAAQRPRHVDVTFQHADSGWRFVISSIPVDGCGPRQVHVTGMVAVREHGRPEAVDLVTLRERLREPTPRATGRMGVVTLGPRWDCVTAVTGATAEHTERLLDIELAEPFHPDLRAHPLHPVLLDCATSAARIGGRDEPHLPFGYGSLVQYAELPARLTAHVVRRPAADGLIVADVDLYASDGRPLAHVDGFTMRRVSDTGFVAEPANQDTGLAPGEGIAPAHGAALFLSLLGVRHPYQVAVRPYTDGAPRPVPERPAPPAPIAASRPTPAAPGTPVTAAAPVPSAPVANDVRGRLAALWTETLGLADIPSDTDFFDLGGNSLSAVELMNRIRDSFGVRLSVIAMFDHPTLDALAKALIEQGAS